jgi:hypothetical protein
MNLKLKRFMHALTSEQQERFASLAETTVGTIRHYVTGRRVPSAGAAIAMEKASLRVIRLKDVDKAVTPLGRGELSPACKDCEYRKACTARMD